MSEAAAADAPEITVKESFEELQSEFTDTVVERIVMDSVAIMRVVKDCMDSQFDNTTGTLLGMDNGTTIEITNTFPIPAGDDSVEGEESLSDLISRCYKEANIDTAEVGWYTTAFGNTDYLTPETISAQALWEVTRNPKYVLLVFDPFRTMLEGTSGSRPLALHAYRLSPEFSAFYKTNKFTVENIQAHKVSYKHIFEEIPIFIRPSFPSAIGSLLQRVSLDPEMRYESRTLDTMVSPLIDRSVDSLIQLFDQMESQQRTFVAYQRNTAVQLRRFYKGIECQVPTQPSQLDSLLLTSRMTVFCDQILNAAADSTAKLYFVNDIIKEKEKEKEK